MGSSGNIQHESNNDGDEDDRATSARAGILLIRSFHTISLTLLTLLLPLSFLLLARLSLTPQLLAFPVSSQPFPIFLYTILLVPCILVPFLCLSALLHSSTGHTLKPNLHVAWAVTSILQVSVGLGIEATVATGVAPVYLGSAPSTDEMWIQHAVSFLGVYVTMIFWSRAFARQAVDDTVYGAATEETAVERAVVGLVFGVVWVTMLRSEMQRLGSMRGVEGWHGRVCWVVAMLMLVIGVIRVVRGVIWMGKNMLALILHRQREGEQGPDRSDSFQIDLKV